MPEGLAYLILQGRLGPGIRLGTSPTINKTCNILPPRNLSLVPLLRSQAEPQKLSRLLC